MTPLSQHMPTPNEKPFQYYPFNSVVGFVRTQAQAEGLLAALQTLGYIGDTVGVLHGDAGVRYLDRSGQHHGVVGRLSRLVQHLADDEAGLLQRSEAELIAGSYLFRVITGGERADMLRVRDAFKQHEGYFITFYLSTATEITD